MVAEEDDLPAAIARLLAEPKPDPVALSQAVRARFGREVFLAQVGMAFDRLFEPKYNENHVFAIESTGRPGRIEQYFSCLDHEFATPRINGIFHRINELKRA